MKKLYKDCTLKHAILTTLAQSEHGMTTRELFDRVGHPSWESFRVEVYQLWRRGQYLTRSKVDGKREYRYSLSKLGKEHSVDAFKTIRKRQENIHAKVSAILNDDEAFRQAVEQEASRRSSCGPVSGGSGPVSTPTTSVNDENVISMIRAKDKEITMLQMQLQELRRQSQTGAATTVRAQAQRERTPEEVKEERLRIKRRRKLAEMYASQNMYLDSTFFAKWGDLRPYKLKFKQWLSDNSIEIMSKNNPEIRRGHAHKQPIPPQAISQCGFHIVKMDSKGISIAGRGLPDGKARMSF
jgi:hypothetical protein